MTHYRTAYRTAVRAALMGDPAFAGYTSMSAWARDIDPSTLPVLAVATPSETKQLDGLETSERGCTLMVVAKIQGGDDLEDQLDDLSVTVEMLVLAALGEERPGFLTDTETSVDGGGSRRIGTLTMKFGVTAWLADPLTGA